MIALGGRIGTGLFVASGKAIATGGPAGAMLAYMLIGAMVYCVIMSLGEMAALLHVAGRFTHFPSRFVDDLTSIMVAY
jgi:lysine-specific permease